MGSRPRETVKHQPDDVVTAQEFDCLVQELSNWNRWEPEDQRGALHFVTAERTAAATPLIRDGLTVSLSLPLNTTPAIDCPAPADHPMTAPTERQGGEESVQFMKDHVGLDYHNGQRVFAADLEAAEREQRVSVGEGDILLVRTGHSRRLAEFAPWNTPESKPGLHPTALRLVASRAVSALGSDGNSDTPAEHYRGGRLPDSRARREFLFIAAPLRIVSGTGSPINPLAVL